MLVYLLEAAVETQLTKPPAARQFIFRAIHLPNRYPKKYLWIKRLSLTLLLIVASMSLSLLLTPKEEISIFGQTVEVGAASPSLSLSGPGQANLFGEGTLDTVQYFTGPIRPLIVWQHFNRNDAADQFIQSSTKDGKRVISTDTGAVGTILANGWTHYFVRLILVTGLLVVLLYFLGLGVVAMLNPKETQGPRVKRWSFLICAMVLAMVSSGASVALSAKSAQDQLSGVQSLADLVGSAEFLPVPAKVGPEQTGIGIVVLGDSTAAAIGNTPVAAPTKQDKACYRSSDSYAMVLQNMTGQRALNLACSGASIMGGLLGEQYTEGQMIPPQLGILKSITSASTVILSIGANDVNWADSLNLCYGMPSCNDNASDLLSMSRLDAFKIQYTQLLQQLSNLPSNPTVIVNLYYDPFGTTFDCLALKDPQASFGAPVGYGFASDPGKKNQAKKIADKIVPLRANLDRLNQVLQQGAQNFGFLVATPRFEGHELCTDQPWIQGMNGNAPFHPTAAGELAIAAADQQLLIKIQTPLQASGIGIKPASASAS
jgi:lysophospholipase L1-like esterase